MAKNYVKFPCRFFDSKEWSRPRTYSKAEALLYLLNREGDMSLRHLATAWQWSKSSVQRFIGELKADGFWDTSWDTFWDTKQPKDKQVTESYGTPFGTLSGTHLIKNNNNPPNILSSSKEESNIYSPLIGEEIYHFDSFVEFQEWIKRYAPRVAKMREPFTETQFESLITDFDAHFLCGLLKDMHNYQHLLTKNISANLTFRNWARRRKQWDNEKAKQPSTRNASKPNDDELARAVAEGLSRANTQQEWQG